MTEFDEGQVGREAGDGRRLMEALEALRLRARRRLLMYGALTVAAGGFAAFLFVVWMDWLFWFPGVLRLVVVGLFVGGFAAAFTRWLLLPAMAKWRMDQLAAIVQRHFGDFDHRLTSAVAFVGSGPNGSPELADEVVHRAAEMLQSRPPEKVLTSGPLTRAILLFSGALVLVMTLAAVRGDWLWTGITRYAKPFGDVEWPRDVEIVVGRNELIVPFGESIEVGMQVARGSKPHLRGIVHFRDASGAVHSRAMTDMGDGQYVCMIDAVSSDMTFWFEAGDDNTYDHPGVIRAVARPDVTQVSAVVFPPDYAEGVEERTYDLLKGPADAVNGSRVVLMIHANQAVGHDQSGGPAAWLGWEDESKEKLRLGRVSDSVLAAELLVEESLRFHVEVINEQGLANRVGEWLEISAVADAPPTLRVELPARTIDATPAADVQLRVFTEDDFGLSEVAVTGRVGDRESMFEIALNDSMTVTRAPSRIVGSVSFDWQMSSLGVDAGDVVAYVVWVRDNRPVPSEADEPGERITLPMRDRGQVVRSAPMRIRILSAVEFEDRLRGEFAILEGKVRELLLEEESILEETVGARDKLTEGGAWDSALRGIVDATAGRQAQQMRKLEILAERFSDIGARMAMNHVGNESAMQLIQSLNSALKKDIAREMSQSAHSLQESLSQASDASGQLEIAAARQERAAKLLRQALQSMGQWGEFQEVLTRVRDLLDRQQLVRAETARISPQTLGQKLEDLPEQARASLRATARRQSQLSEDLARLTDQMRRMIDRIREKEPASADALAAAARAAAAGEVKESMDRAAEAVEENRTSAAALEHRRIEEGLKQVLDTLQERRSRELAELAKRVEAAIDAVNRLLSQQKELIAANVEAQAVGPAAEAFATQAAHQRQLARNTGALAEELSSAEKTVDAGRQLQEADAPMEQAMSGLGRADGKAAQADQESAVVALEKTVAILERISAEAKQDAKRQSLTRVIDLLAGIIERQEDVHGRSTELVEEIAGGERLNRKSARQVARLAGEQEELRVETEDIRAELEDAKTYGWILDNCVQRMDEAKSMLDQRSLTQELADAQLAAIDNLRLLVDAIRATMGLESSDEFADSGSGAGGGEGAAAGNKGLPGVTELLVLRAMQLKLNQETEAFERGYNQEHPTEQHLRQLRSLGRRQREIQKMLSDLLKPNKSTD